jgi:hypothetical protein
MPSDLQIAANRANAQLSTGPKTEAGKAASSHNAIKTGLTGRTVLLPTDDRQAFDAHVARLLAEFQPANDAEKALVHSIAGTEWRLLRIPVLESGIYAVGRRKLAEEFADESDPAVRAVMIEAQIFLTHRKDFSNLALQEARLRRHHNAELAQLKEMQRQRVADRAARLDKALQYAEGAQRRNVEFDPAALGFEFSNEEIRNEIENRRARYFLGGIDQFAPEYHRVLARARKPQAA